MGRDFPAPMAIQQAPVSVPADTNVAWADTLGWVGVERDSPQVHALRNELLANNGMRGLEVLAPHEVERAAQLFDRDGFVLVRDALTPAQLESMRAGCDAAIREMLALDPRRFGNRGSHRYSFGGASLTGHLVHRPEWAMLLDLPTVTPILTAIFGSADYMARGGGGDFCLPGAVEYQPLHSDMGDRQMLGGATFGSFKDSRGRLTYRDLPVPFVCCNFTMVDFHALNGPTRQIPGTQHSREAIPGVTEEPKWMKLSTLCPAPAGSVIIRDVRAWHGGTPNLTDEVRASPNAEFFAPWYREAVPVSMPRAMYDTLSAHAQRLCRYIVADSATELVTGWHSDLGNRRIGAQRKGG